MKFKHPSEIIYGHLEIVFVYTSHFDIHQPTLKIIGRLEGNGYLADTPGHIELLQKELRFENNKSHLVWNSQTGKILPQTLDVLAENIKNIWSENTHPQVKFVPTANTIFSDLTITIHLTQLNGDELNAVLRAVPLDGLVGIDSPKVQNFINLLSEIGEFGNEDFNSSLEKTAELIPIQKPLTTNNLSNDNDNQIDSSDFDELDYASILIPRATQSRSKFIHQIGDDNVEKDG